MRALCEQRCSHVNPLNGVRPRHCPFVREIIDCRASFVKNVGVVLPVGKGCSPISSNYVPRTARWTEGAEGVREHSR